MLFALKNNKILDYSYSNINAFQLTFSYKPPITLPSLETWNDRNSSSGPRYLVDFSPRPWSSVNDYTAVYRQIEYLLIHRLLMKTFPEACIIMF